jgi:hypothetical protein
MTSLSENEQYKTLLETANKLNDKIVFTNMAQFNSLLKPRKDYNNIDPTEDEIEEMEEELGKKIPEYYKKGQTWKANIFNKVRSRANRQGIGLSRSFGVPREWREDFEEETTVLELNDIDDGFFEPATAILDLGITNPDQVVNLIINSMKMSILLGNVYNEGAKVDVETAEVSDISKENKKVIRSYRKLKEKEKKAQKEAEKQSKADKMKADIVKVASVVSLINPLTPNTKEYKDFLLPLFNNVPEKDRTITLSFDNIMIG